MTCVNIILIRFITEINRLTENIQYLYMYEVDLQTRQGQHSMVIDHT